MRKEAINTFLEGMICDLNPLTTPNNVLTSALNATLITFQGNEFVLLNDMGNGRVETAYLPAGYVPLGVTEFGGIVYVVSYNPLINKSQVGSFPSPERNITSEEISEIAVELGNDDFNWKPRDNGAFSANVFYIQKDLYDLQLNPGDKFIVYAGPGEISGNLNEDRLYNQLEEIVDLYSTKLVKLSIATATDEGKIVKLEDLRSYKVGNTDYIMPEMKKVISSQDTDLDAYRNLVTSPYNVFNSRVSGRLLIVAELLTIDSFDVTMDVEFEDSNSQDPSVKNAKVLANMSYESGDGIHLYGVGGYITNGIASHSSSDVSIKWEENVREANNKLLYSLSYSIKDPKLEVNLYWSLTPAMSYGPISYLKKSGIIQLHEVNSGNFYLSEWRYYIDNNSIQLGWTLQAYPEKYHTIEGVRFILSGYNDNGTVDSLIYEVSKKKSYNGAFTEIIPLEQTYYKITGVQGNPVLLRNKLYFVTIEIEYHKDGISKDDLAYTEKYKYFHRFLYTADIFNRLFIEGVVTDFSTLQPNLEIGVTTNTSFTKTYQDKSKLKIGSLFSDELTNEEDTICVSLIYTKLKLNIENIPELADDYDLFAFDDKTVNILTTVNNEGKNVTFDKYAPTYTGQDSVNMDTYLELKEYKEYTGGQPELPEESKLLVNDPYNLGLYITGTTFTKDSKAGDNSKYNLDLDIIEHIKAFAHTSLKTITYKGFMHPVAYDEDSFSKYNLKYQSGKFVGTGVSAFGQAEKGGSDGREWYYDATGGVLKYETRSKKADEITTDFLENYCQEAMEKAWKGVTGSICVCIYAYDYDKDSRVLINSNIDEIEKSWPFRTHDRRIGTFGESNTTTFKNLKNTPIFVFIKRTDGKWCPINMVSKLGTGYTNVNTLTFNRGGITVSGTNSNGTTNFSIALSFGNLFNTLASMLNQLYMYEVESLVKNKYIPSSTFYISKYTSNFNVEVKSEILQATGGTIIQIKSGKDFIPLNELFKEKLFNENQKSVSNKNKDQQVFDVDKVENNNITPIIETKETINLATWTTVNSGIDLRDIIMGYEKTAYGTLIMDNKGNIHTFDANLNPEFVYFLKEGAPLKIDSSFKFKQITGWTSSSSGTYIANDPTANNILNTQSIANRFVIVDGELRLDENFSPPKTRLDRHPDSGSGDNGSFGAFANFSPFDFLRCWPNN